MSQASVAKSDTVSSGPNQKDRLLVRIAIAFTAWAERWFPDAFVFVAIAVVVVALAAMLNGASPLAVSQAFGDGFWSLITFTMQMTIVAIGGYVVASSPPAAKLIDGLAAMPRSGAGAVAFVAAVSMLTSLLSWGLSLIFSGLLVRVLALRPILASARPGRSGSAHLPRSCRPTRRACQSRCCRSRASFRSPRRFFSGNRWSSRLFSSPFRSCWHAFRRRPA